jgi:nitrite reductase/ring-hydroxylating ferredoxin subunit
MTTLMSASRREFLDCSRCVLVGLVAGRLPAAGLADLPIGHLDSGADRVERRYPIPAADSVSVDHAASVIVVREAGSAYAFSLACPHEHAAIKWVADGHRFQCTKHDSRYQATGAHIAGRATRNLDRFPVRRDGSDLVVDLSQVFRSDQDPTGWARATVAV